MNLTTNLDPLFKELGLEKLAPEERKEVEERMTNHFTKVILETVIISLSEEQAKEFKATIEESGEDLEARIVAITARIPGLAQKIDTAVKDEILVLKTAMVPHAN